MNAIKRPLDVIQVETPCTADWDAMPGDDRVRFCSHCQQQVHDLSAMAGDEATRLLCEQAGRLCVRFTRDAAGRTLTLDYQKTPKRRRGWPFWTIFGAAAAACSWVVGVMAGTSHVPSRTITMGEPAPGMFMGVSSCFGSGPATTQSAPFTNPSDDRVGDQTQDSQ